MKCSKCGESEVINKHFKLCLECNNLRLYGNKFGKRYTYIPVSSKPLRAKEIKSKKKKKRKSLFVPDIIKIKKESNTFMEDEEFYEKCFNLSNHKCEECGKALPEEFRDDNGKVIARWRYSHIIQKSISSELRHDIENINHLCLLHHVQWENGERKKMKIYEKNRKKFPNYL